MIAWHPVFIDKHCSSWSVVQTLEWLNYSRATWLRTMHGWRFALGEKAALLPDQRVAEVVADQTEIRQVSHSLSEKHRWLPYTELRYCPICIRCGMHYGHQQDYRFRSCIIHQRPLRTGCPNCRSSIDTKGLQCQGFVCGQCNQSMLGQDVPELRTVSRKAWDTFILDELENWQWEAGELHLGHQRPGTGYSSDLWDRFSTNANAGLYWRALTLNPNPRVSAALEPAPLSFRVFPISALTHPIQSDSEYVLAPYWLVLRAVSRHLRRTHLRGHGACYRYAAGTVGSLGRGVTPEVQIHPDLCCLGQGYALWQLQWRRELKYMLRYLIHRDPTTRRAEIRLPSLRAAQLSLVSSFEQWVVALAEIREAFAGSGKRAILDGVGSSPHWALLQEGTYYSCPIHLRHPDLAALSYCDHGGVYRQEVERRRAMVQKLARLR